MILKLTYEISCSSEQEAAVLALCLKGLEDENNAKLGDYLQLDGHLELLSDKE